MDDPATIAAYGNADLPDGTADRPLVTFAVLAYNQERYIREAVEGAFRQTYSPLEIVLSDDHSSDATFQIMEDMAREYQGPHLVRVRRGHRNLGVAQHFDILIRRARGQYFVAAAGDDISDAERTAACIELFTREKELGFVEVHCRNFSGEFTGHLPVAAPGQADAKRSRIFTTEDVLAGRVTGFIGAGRTYKRHAYTRFPPLLTGCPEEDTPALLRCLYAGRGAILARQLVRRRLHGGNLSSHASLSKMSMPLLTAQYRSDLDDALGMTLIDRDHHDSFARGIDRYSFRKQCSIDVHTGFRGAIGLRDVLLSRHFSPGEKFYLLRRGMLSRAGRSA